MAYPKLRDKADTVTKKSNVNCPNWQKKVSLWISTASVEAIGIMDRDYGSGLWIGIRIGIMDQDYGSGLRIGIMGRDYVLWVRIMDQDYGSGLWVEIMYPYYPLPN